MTPSVPIRSDAEKRAILNAIQGLSTLSVDPSISFRLIDPVIVATNVTSQFRLFVLEEGTGRVEIRRSGIGWGRDVTVAAVIFRNEDEFKTFLRLDSFSHIKSYLAESVLRKEEVPFPNIDHNPLVSSAFENDSKNVFDSNIRLLLV